MVEFFYTSTYTEHVCDETNCDEASRLTQFDIVVYHLADKYLLNATLGVEAQRKFSKYIGAEKDMNALTTAIVDAFEAGPEEGDHLTSIATSAAKKHHAVLLGSGKEDFRRATRKFQLLAAELAEHVAEKNIKLMGEQTKDKPAEFGFRCSNHRSTCAARGPITSTLRGVSTSPVHCVYCGIKTAVRA